MTNSSLVSLKDILSEANSTGIISLENLTEQNLRDKLQVLKGADPTNPRLFVWEFFQYGNYLMNATESIEGQILVDLGCGRNLDGYIFAKIAGAKAYIGNDHVHIPRLYEKFNSYNGIGDSDLVEKITIMKNFLQTDPRASWYNKETVSRIVGRMDKYLSRELDIPVALVPEDMTTFLKRLPSNSVSVLTSGIDRQIISDKYIPEIESEIVRVLSPSGALISWRSILTPKELVKDVKSHGPFEKYYKQT